MTLALCAIALNEEQFLDGMLESVKGMVDEVMLGIDSRTTDHTLDIARAYAERTLVNVRVFNFDWHDSFAEACNLAIERARSEWILRLDADERLLPEGRVRISELLALGVPLHVDGFLMLLLETDLDGRALGPPQRSAARLFRNVPDLRYMGRIHEEVRYVPDPPRTYNFMLDGGPHILHLGAAPEVLEQRGKRARDRRLLHLRLCDNPDDAVAYCYLALMAKAEGRRIAAMTFAKRALECGPRTLHEDRVAQLKLLMRSAPA